MTTLIASLCPSTAAPVMPPAATAIPAPPPWRERCWTPSGAQSRLGFGAHEAATVTTSHGVHRIELRRSCELPHLDGVVWRVQPGLTQVTVPDDARQAFLAAARAMQADPLLIAAVTLCGDDWHQ